jgi:hypothetical protein
VFAEGRGSVLELCAFVRFVVAVGFVVFRARVERFTDVAQHHEPRLGFVVWVYSRFCESWGWG